MGKVNKGRERESDKDSKEGVKEGEKKDVRK